MSFITNSNNFNLDAAGAVKVAQKTVLGSYVQDKDDLPDFYHRVNFGTASQTWAAEVVTMDSGTGYAICQTYKRHLYLAGFSQSPEVTFNDFGNETDVIKRAGYFSSSTVAPYTADLDGFFLEADGTNHKLVIYKNGTLQASINRSSWDDPMDGSGPSGIDIDFNNFTVVEWQFLYLGGTGLEMRFNVGGTPYLAHTYKNSSINPSTFIGSPVQPVRFEVRNDGAAGTMGQICGGVQTGGSLGIVGYPRSIGTTQGNDIDANVVGTQYLVCALKQNNPRSVGFDFVGEIIGLTNDPFVIRFVLDPVIASEPAYAALGNSGFDFIRGDETSGGASDTTVTGGTIIYESYVSSQIRAKDVQANSVFQLGLDIPGNYQVIALTIEPASAGLDVKGAINFKTL